MTDGIVDGKVHDGDGSPHGALWLGTDDKTLAGTEKMIDDGTDDGTHESKTYPTDGYDERTMTSVAGIELICDKTTATMLLGAQFDGTVTVAGIETNELTATETIAVVGTKTTTLDGAHSGTKVYCKYTPVDDGMVT